MLISRPNGRRGAPCLDQHHRGASWFANKRLKQYLLVSLYHNAYGAAMLAPYRQNGFYYTPRGQAVVARCHSAGWETENDLDGRVIHPPALTQC